MLPGPCPKSYLYGIYRGQRYIWNYDGIIYKNGHPETAEPVCISIEGKYRRNINGPEEFSRIIKIGEQLFDT